MNIKLFTLLLIFISAIILRGQDKQGFDSTNYSIEDCVNIFSPENTEETKAGFQYWFADKNFLDGRTIKLSVVGPGLATHKPHKHSEDEFFFIVEGIAEFYLNGETKTIGPMTSLYCPSNSEHGIRNPGSKELRYLVIKKYKIEK